MIETQVNANPNDRIATALERIATALEQGVLERIDNSHQPFVASDPYPAELEPVDLPPVTAPPLSAQPVMADVCPIHHTPWKTVPAGTSKRTGQPYSAFRACSTTGCDQRPRL